MNILIASMVRDGFILQTTSPSRVVFGYRTKDVGSRLLWGVPFGEAPEARVQYTLTEDVQGVSVVGRAQLVTNPGIGLEPDRIKPWRNAKVGRTMQAVLREVAEQVEEQLVVHSDP